MDNFTLLYISYVFYTLLLVQIQCIPCTFVYKFKLFGFRFKAQHRNCRAHPERLDWFGCHISVHMQELIDFQSHFRDVLVQLREIQFSVNSAKLTCLHAFLKAQFQSD